MYKIWLGWEGDKGNKGSLLSGQALPATETVSIEELAANVGRALAAKGTTHPLGVAVADQTKISQTV